MTFGTLQVCDGLRVATLNCRGLNDGTKNEYVRKTSRENLWDVILLQETKIHSESTMSKIAKAWNRSYTMFSRPATITNSGGLITLIKKCSDISIINEVKLPTNRYLEVCLKWDESLWSVVNVYAPNSIAEQRQFYCSLRNRGRQWASHVIVGGDFNAIDDPVNDHFSTVRVQKCIPLINFKVFIDDSRLCDTWTLLHPNVSGHTRFGNTSSSRIDRIYVSDIDTEKILSAELLTGYKSDHKWLSVTLKGGTCRKNKSPYWKFDKYVISDSRWKQEVEDLLDTIQLDDPNLPYTWDIVKLEVAQITRKFTRGKCRKQGLEEGEILRAINELEMLEQLNEINRKKLADLKLQWEAVVERELTRKMCRLGGRWLHGHEQLSKRALQEELSYSGRKRITELEVDGRVVNDESQICEYVHSFYKSLYAMDPGDSRLADRMAQNISKLDPLKSESLNSPITLQEVDEVVRLLGRNKAPGPDGITREFYGAMWHKLRHILVAVYNRCINIGLLSPSQRCGAIVLLAKAREQSKMRDIRNWRAITLLNTDYKILTKILANRLKMVVGDVIRENQTCAIPGRNISDAILLYNIVVHEIKKDKRGIIVNIDQEKAFDKVNRRYLFQILKNIGVEGFYLDAVQTCYRQNISQVIVNGRLTDAFPVHRSIRQGCPLSMLLYAIQIEPVLNALRERLELNGLFASQGITQNLNVNAYADDIVLLLKDVNSCEPVFDVFKQYSRATGSTVNIAKCSGYNPYRVQHVGGGAGEMEWSTNGIKLLGIWVGDQSVTNANWNGLMTKIEKSVRTWKSRKLSYAGRVRAWNTFEFSRLLYVIRNSFIPRAVLHRIDSFAAKTVWGRNYEPTCRSMLIAPRRDGGLGLRSAVAAMVTSRLKLLREVYLDNGKKLWMPYVRAYIGFSECPDDNKVECVFHPGGPRMFSLMKVHATLFVRLQAEIPLLSDWATQSIYSVVVKQILPAPKLVNRLGISKAVKVNEVIFRLPVIPSIKSTLWMFAADLLPTSEFLSRKRFLPAHVTDQCIECKQQETQEHAILHCPAIASAWQQVENLGFSRVNGSWDEMVDFILGSDIGDVAIVACVVHAIWRMRNDRIFRGGLVEDHVDVKEHVRGLLLYHYFSLRASQDKLLYTKWVQYYLP